MSAVWITKLRYFMFCLRSSLQTTEYKHLAQADGAVVYTLHVT